MCWPNYCDNQSASINFKKIMAKKVNINELARRYTTAVFELAKSQNKLQQVGRDLESLQTVLKSAPQFIKLISAKTYSPSEQVAALKEFGSKFDPLTVNFLMVVAQNGRLAYLPEIVDAFRNRIAEENGELKAEITTAQKLGEKLLNEIAKDLSVKTGKTVKVTENVRPEIIGGLIVKIGAKMFDYSVKSRLTRLKNKLKEAA